MENRPRIHQRVRLNSGAKPIGIVVGHTLFSNLVEIVWDAEPNRIAYGETSELEPLETGLDVMLEVMEDA